MHTGFDCPGRRRRARNKHAMVTSGPRAGQYDFGHGPRRRSRAATPSRPAAIRIGRGQSSRLDAPKPPACLDSPHRANAKRTGVVDRRSLHRIDHAEESRSAQSELPGYRGTWPTVLPSSRRYLSMIDERALAWYQGAPVPQIQSWRTPHGAGEQTPLLSPSAAALVRDQRVGAARRRTRISANPVG